MTAPKIRALQALADATDRPFLANAPLMAIVEAVQVLNEAGLLAGGAANVPAVHMAAAAELSLHRRVWRVIDDETLDDSAHVVQNIVEVLDSHKPMGAAKTMCELVDDAENAKAVLDDEGFHGRTLEAQVRALVVAWSEARNAADPLGTNHFECPDCGPRAKSDEDGCCASCGADLGIFPCDPPQIPEPSMTEECPATSPPPDIVRFDFAPNGQRVQISPDVPVAERVPCPKCGNPLTPTGMCLNFPLCPDAVIPF